MKLKGRLRHASPDLLKSIAEFWKLVPEDEPFPEDSEKLTKYLYPRLQAPAQFKAAFESLQVSEREIIYFLTLHGGELPVDEFRRRTGLHDSSRFDETFERLNRRGFLWREKIKDEKVRFDVVGIPEPFVRLIELPPYWKGFLGYFLQALSLDELKAIARHGLDLKYEGRRKQVLVHFLRSQLLDPKVLKNCVDRQDETENEIFRHLLQQNGASIWRDLLDEGIRKKFNHQKAESLQKLTKHSGLAFLNQTSPDHYNNLVIVPKDVRRILQNGFRRDERTLTELSRSTDRPGSGAAAQETRPNVILDNTQNILRDLAILLAFAGSHDLKVLNNGGVGRNDLKKILPQLSHHKTIKYVSFLVLFAMAKKLIIPVGNRWRTSKTAGEWLQDSKRCYRELYEYWLNTNEWNEEFIDGDVVHVDSYPQNLINITELRKLILRVLEKSPEETWIDFETFAESLLPQVAIEIPGRFDHTSNEKNNRHTLLIMESVLAESAYWFGLVTLGVAETSAAQELGSRQAESVSPFEWTQTVPAALLGGEQYRFSFKVSSTARQMFDGRFLEPDRLFSKYEDSSLPYHSDTPSFTVQPNLEIITPPDLQLSVFYRLLAFTAVKKVDVMTTLEVSRDTLRQGMQHGLSGEEIVHFLEASSRRGLPETVQQLVEECGTRHGEIDMGLAGGYIMASDPIYVEELRANPRIARYIKDIVGETVILLNRTVDLKKLEQEIQKIGFMARVASDTVHVTGEGLYHVTLRPEELYEMLAVLTFAQGLEEKHDGPIFENRIRPIVERLSQDAQGDINPDYYVEPLLKTFQKNYEQLITRQKDDEKRKLKKQVNRLLTRVPRRREPIRYTGENPTSDPQGVMKLMKFAIEHEMQVKIHYRRSTGEEIDEVIEPESMQSRRIYALCPEQDEHHIYVVNRILQAAL